MKHNQIDPHDVVNPDEVVWVSRDSDWASLFGWGIIFLVIGMIIAHVIVLA